MKNEEETVEISQEADNPKIGDIKWTEYVLSLLEPNEKSGDAPKVAGLRRLIPQLLGDIVAQTTNVVQVPTSDNNRFCSIVHRISIKKNTGEIITFDGAADASEFNLTDLFVMYPVAMAETRAEGRAIRRALNINAVVSEEIAAGGIVSRNEKTTCFIDSQQSKVIRELTKRMKIDIEKFLAQYAGVPEESLDTIEYGKAISLIDILKNYRNDANLIPSAILA